MATCWIDARERSIATLSTLHVGIEPALLALLTATGAMPASAAGWVVGAGQSGMTAGALFCWRSSVVSRRSVAVGAALLGTGASLDLAFVSDLGGVLLLRLLLGGAMGLLFARAAAAAARELPHRAIGVILLSQQLAATVTMIALPIVAARWSASAALAVLAAVPLVAGLLVRGEPARCAALPVAADEDSLRASAPMFTMALLIAATMIVWSYIGVVGTVLGMADGTVSMAIAFASLASAPAALLASYTVPRYPPALTALACGLGIISPLLLPEACGLSAYVAAMALFNATSTFATIRFSAFAMKDCVDVRGRRSVALVQSVATAGGAPFGAIAVQLGGLPALTWLVLLLATAAVTAQLALRYRPPNATATPLPATS